MSKSAFESIKVGLEQAVEFANAKTEGSRVHQVRVSQVDVAALRTSLGMTQAEFAASFGVNVSTVRNWEQGRRQPEGPARVLLHVIKKHPEWVKEAVHHI